MSALPIEVRATDPPSQAVEVLTRRINVGPAHAANPRYVLIYLFGALIGVKQGRPEPCPTPPEAPALTSPLAWVFLSACCCSVRQNQITQLNPDGSPA